MDLVFFLGKLGLAGIFTLAAVTKLVDQAGARKTITDFGFPDRWARPVGLLLPLVELVIAGLLVAPRSGLWGGAGAAALLTIFMAVIAANLVQGRTPDCHCFGQIHSEPVGWPTLLRNLLLVTVAAAVAWRGRNGHGIGFVQAYEKVVSGPYAGPTIVTVIVVLAFVVQGWLTFHLLRQHGRLLLRIDVLEATLQEVGLLSTDGALSPIGLPIGDRAPSFDLPLLSGGTSTLEHLRESGKPVLLIFSDPGCEPCSALLPEIARWEREEVNKLTLALVSRGAEEANREKVRAYGLKTVLLQRDQEVAEAYHALGTPSAALVDHDGLVGSHLAVGAQAIAHMVAQATGRGPVYNEPSEGVGGHHKTAPALLPILSGVHLGQPAPSFQLSDLDGNAVELDRNDGRDTLLLFWNPNCRFCSDMVADLRAWERECPTSTPDIVVISSGSVEQIREMRLQSRVLSDSRFSVGALYGVQGTPSAILVDPNGNIASQIAVGAAAVLALAGVEWATRDEKPVTI